MIAMKNRQAMRRSRRFAAAGGSARCRSDLRIIGAAPHPMGMGTPSKMGYMAAAQDSSPAAPGAAPAAQKEACAVSLEGKRIVICEDEGVTQLQLRRRPDPRRIERGRRGDQRAAGVGNRPARTPRHYP